ncbi:MAG TPA: SDR family NAD(P)-dependent oxidoreductase [Burkholderiaceae bacterium]|nr:SDR family NAD(P)-dependent oxidoreductase [Burkholderiaceae bacterium]
MARKPDYRSVPRRFRRPRLLVLGCGDVGLRLAALAAGRARVFGVVRRADAAAAVRDAGAVPIVADLDRWRSLRRLQGLASTIVHSAPPPPLGDDDPRTRRALARLHRARRWVYLSTTGVYGDCGGARIDETRPVAPRSDRARRRVAAERRLRRRAAILRVPGIYARDRLPEQRLRAGTPAILAGEDGYSNHIHADDLARIVWAATLRAPIGRVYNAVDDTELRIGDWLDAVASALSLPAPLRLPRAQVEAIVSPLQWSFLSESRRISNARIKRELGIRLRYPTVHALLGRLPDRAGADII